MRPLSRLVLIATLLAASLSSPALAGELPMPHEVAAEVLTRETVRRVTGVSEVLGHGRLRGSAGSGKVSVRGGLLLFPSPRTGAKSDAAIQVHYLLALARTAKETREGYGMIRLAAEKHIKALGAARSHALGDRAQTRRAVMWPGSDTETYRAEGRLLKGRYVLYIWADGVRRRFSAERIESILVELMRLLATRLPVDGYASAPAVLDDSSIVRSNEDPVIASIEVVTPGKAGVIAHDQSIKVVARYEDAESDGLQHRWEVHDARGIKLYEGAGKATRGGSTAICKLRRETSDPLSGPLTVTLRVQDERGGRDSKQIQVPVREPVATLLGFFGDVHIARKHKRMRGVTTTSLYEGDLVTIYRDLTWLALSRDERAALGKQREPLSFIDVEWPKYQARGRFLVPASSPTLWTKVLIGRRPQHVTGLGDAIVRARDQLFTYLVEDKRDDLFEAVIRRTTDTVGPAVGAVVGPLFAVATSPDATAGDTVYVELKSEIVIKTDGRGGLGMYTLEGAPTVIEPNGRRRFTFPTGTWASIDDRGAHAEGAFPPGSVHSRWADVDAHPVLRDPRRLMGASGSEDAGTPWGIIAGLIALLVIGLLVVRQRSKGRQGAERSRRAQRARRRSRGVRPPPLPAKRHRH